MILLGIHWIIYAAKILIVKKEDIKVLLTAGATLILKILTKILTIRSSTLCYIFNEISFDTEWRLQNTNSFEMGPGSWKCPENQEIALYQISIMLKVFN